MSFPNGSLSSVFFIGPGLFEPGPGLFESS